MNKQKRPMTDQEIVREYLEAKSPGKQIRILADENLCTPETIRNILRREGIPVGRKEPAPKPERPATESATAPELPELPAVKPAIPRDLALSMRVRHAAVEAIAELMGMADKIDGDELEFQERVRGILCLVHTLEKEDLDDAED